MLRDPRIENLVLIDEAELVLDERLTAITGETGAGKTTSRTRSGSCSARGVTQR